MSLLHQHPPEEPTGLSQSCDVTLTDDMANTSHLLENGRPIAALMKDITFLKHDVTQLKSEMLDLRSSTSSGAYETFSLYLLHPWISEKLCSVICSIVQSYTIVSAEG